MKKLLISAAVITLLFPGFSHAFGPYVALEAGTYSPRKTLNQDVSSSYETGYALGGALGFDLGLIRLENELIYREGTTRAGGGNPWALGWLVNGWFDIKNPTPFTPYLGGGFGYGRGRVASPGVVDNSGSGIAYQAGAGVDVRLSRKVSFDVSYRYFGLEDKSNNNSSAQSINQAGSSALAALRMRF